MKISCPASLHHPVRIQSWHRNTGACFTSETCVASVRKTWTLPQHLGFHLGFKRRMHTDEWSLLGYSSVNIGTGRLNRFNQVLWLLCFLSQMKADTENCPQTCLYWDLPTSDTADKEVLIMRWQSGERGFPITGLRSWDSASSHAKTPLTAYLKNTAHLMKMSAQSTFPQR